MRAVVFVNGLFEYENFLMKTNACICDKMLVDFYVLYNQDCDLKICENAVYVKCKDVNNVENIIEILNSNYDEIPDMILFQSNVFGDEMACRVGDNLSLMVQTNVNRYVIESSNISIEKNVLGMNVTAKMKFNYPIVLSSNFYNNNEVVSYSGKNGRISLNKCRCNFEKIVFEKEQKTIDLTSQKKVIAIGRGCTKSNIIRIEKIAETIGFSVGGTRPTVHNGDMNLSQLIGLSGKELSADKLLILGASGSRPFSYGIEKCDKIVSVNNDSNALIFNHSNIGLVVNCEKFIEKLEQLCENVKNK